MLRDYDRGSKDKRQKKQSSLSSKKLIQREKWFIDAIKQLAAHTFRYHGNYHGLPERIFFLPAMTLICAQ